jgi:hypothetical protein
MNFSLVCLRCLSLCHWYDLVLCNDCEVLWGDCHSDIYLVIILISVESYILGIFSLLSLLSYLSYHTIIFIYVNHIHHFLSALFIYISLK